MDKRFREIVESLHAKYEALMAMPPVTVDTAPTGEGTPLGGVYLFSIGDQHLYAGRTRRRVRERLKDHVSTAEDCPFAWRLAREMTGRQPTYRQAGSQRDLLKDPQFRIAYEQAKLQIRSMEVRYVGEADPLRQGLLEIYVAVASGAKHNDFDTH